MILAINKNSFNIIYYYFRCTWNQKGCKPEDFTQKLTDSGVCFTFNSGQHSVKTINEPGIFLQIKLENLNHISVIIKL